MRDWTVAQPPKSNALKATAIVSAQKKLRRFIWQHTIVLCSVNLTPRKPQPFLASHSS